MHKSLRIIQLVFTFIRRIPDLFRGNIALFLEDSGGVFIKFGQTISVRPDIIGDKIANNLRTLQDKIKPFDFKHVNQRIQKDFGKSIEEIFIEFEHNPIAAGSIAQVHKANFNGITVAVKIVRPDIEKKYRVDLDLLSFIVKTCGIFSKRVIQLKLQEVLLEIRKTMTQEIDMRLEAAACSEMQENFLGDEILLLPKVIWQLSSKNILCMTWLSGTSIYDKTSLMKNGFSPRDILSKIAKISFNQIYRDGFFHADLHPGNIFVTNDGRIAIIDFGITGRLSEKDRIAMAEILYGFLKKDYLGIAKTHKKVGYIKENTDIALFAQACRAVGEKIVGSKVISFGELIAQLVKINEDFEMNTQPQLVLLQKTMLLIEGIGKTLDPHVNMWQLVDTWIQNWGLKNLTPEAKVIRFLKNVVDDLTYKI